MISKKKNATIRNNNQVFIDGKFVCFFLQREIKVHTLLEIYKSQAPLFQINNLLFNISIHNRLVQSYNV